VVTVLPSSAIHLPELAGLPSNVVPLTSSTRLCQPSSSCPSVLAPAGPTPPTMPTT
jgi:hypothetical protein